MEKAIELREISKKIGDQDILHNVSMTIKKGSIYGFLGPNGSGKTTVMKIILNLLKADSGIVKVFNHVVEPTSYKYLQTIGSIIEYPVFYDHLSAWENLNLHCEYSGYYNKEQIHKVLDIVGLKDIKKKKVKEFSLGMKQRLGIARTLITQPEILLLDEPINGLDPFGIREVRELLVRINQELGTTILISSHIISEIESISDTIGFIKNGRMVREVERSMLAQENLQYIEVTVSDVKKAVQVLDETLMLKNFKVISTSKIRIYEQEVDSKEINRELVLHGVDILAVDQQSNTLEEYFMELMSEGEKR
ncbi:ABC transporter ATP-binding protein [Candidatus Enterococcus mansonii]|uniref:ABC transporter domain-containing protein n=1 Tax=Candidatus Enterococcus mansonii TaxID=1834181 RepID=A0A242CIH0_9ENTE|nr:ATP-binding cassette domain-containing protein [Enterococcus sp. 4G2_DIV0659]OTO10043.1 hypothetical protein A5880_000726 [Enterococcus sp. 4G2_DIV0659]